APCDQHPVRPCDRCEYGRRGGSRTRARLLGRAPRRRGPGLQRRVGGIPRIAGNSNVGVTTRGVVVIAIAWIAAALLAAAAVLGLIRIGRGPTMLNRVIALDVFTTIVVCALCVEAAFRGHGTTLPVLVVLSLVGFVGSVSMA